MYFRQIRDANEIAEPLFDPTMARLRDVAPAAAR